MIDRLADLLRPTIKPRKGDWIHLNTAAQMTGYKIKHLYELLEQNGIITSPQNDYTRSRIYFHEDWVQLLMSGEYLANWSLLQSQVKDDEMDEMTLNLWYSSRHCSRHKSTDKQVRFLRLASKSKYLNDEESELIRKVLSERYLGKRRINGLLDYLVGTRAMWADGTTDRRRSPGIIDQRKKQHEKAKQAQ